MQRVRQRAQLQLPKLDISNHAKEDGAGTLASQLLRQYDVEAVLGSGTIAVVKRIRRKSDGLLFAAKMVCTQDEEVLAMTRAEHDILSSLSCPFLVRTWGCLQGPQYVSIIMDYCAGGTLEDHVHQQGGLCNETACNLFVQLLKGVDFLHCKRIVHRDLKPANLLLDDLDFKQLKIGDFNSAKQLSSGRFGAMLSQRCTRDYAAPELILEQTWNERVDIWSSGLCLFYMKRVSLPFQSGRSQVQAYFLRESLPPVDWGDVSEDMKLILLDCLAVDFRARPPAMELLVHPSLDVFGVTRRYSRVVSLGEATASDLEAATSNLKLRHAWTQPFRPLVSEETGSLLVDDNSSVCESEADSACSHYDSDPEELRHRKTSALSSDYTLQQLALQKHGRKPTVHKSPENSDQGHRIVVSL